MASTNRTGPQLDEVILAISSRKELSQGQKAAAIAVACLLHLTAKGDPWWHRGMLFASPASLALAMGSSPWGAKEGVIGNPVLVANPVSSPLQIELDLDTLGDWVYGFFRLSGAPDAIHGAHADYEVQA